MFLLLLWLQLQIVFIIDSSLNDFYVGVIIDAYFNFLFWGFSC